MSSKTFASTGDLGPKKVSFNQLGNGLYAYTAEGDPNTGVIIGDDGCVVIDTQATPAMAQDVIARIRSVTDKPIKYVILSHYHAVRVLEPQPMRARPSSRAMRRAASSSSAARPTRRPRWGAFHVS